MKTAINVFLLTVLTTLFYAYVGHMVPQQESHPPAAVEISANMTTAEMVKVGEEIVGGKGTCLSCHTIGSHDEAPRFPDLGGIGSRAASRKEGYSDVEYLAESLYEPNTYIVEGFSPGMVAASKPPVSLSDIEILTVIAYLQSLGGTPSVTMDTKLKWQGQSPAPAPSSSTASSGPRTPQTGVELVTNYGCVTCHSFDEPQELLGPSLHDIGSRMSSTEIYESILEPDATIADGFEAGLMATTLNAMQFYDKVNAVELQTMVEYLANRKGAQ